MEWSCKDTKEYMEKRILGLEVDEDDPAFQDHLTSCTICQVEWQSNESLEKGLQRGFHKIVQEFESPKIQVLLALEKEEEKDLGRTRNPWRVIFWMILLLVLFLLPMAYISMKIASKIVLEKRQMYRQTQKDLEKIVKKLSSFFIHSERISTGASIVLKGSLDPWGNPYYLLPLKKREFLLYSFGPNQKDDGGKKDDIWILVKKIGKIYSIQGRSHSSQLHLKGRK